MTLTPEPARVALQTEAVRGRVQLPGECEVRFRHVMMRDAAYGLLTADDRAAGHRAAARYLEAHGEPDALMLAALCACTIVRSPWARASLQIAANCSSLNV